MKNKIKKWLGIEQINNQLYGVNENLMLIQRSQLNTASDLARLMLDLKCGFVSHESFDFICRMNIRMADHKKQIPIEMVEKINKQK